METKKKATPPNRLAELLLIIEYPEQSHRPITTKQVMFSVYISTTPEKLKNSNIELYPKFGKTKDLQICFWREGEKASWSDCFRKGNPFIALGYYCDEIPKSKDIFKMAESLSGRIVSLTVVENDEKAD